MKPTTVLMRWAYIIWRSCEGKKNVTMCINEPKNYAKRKKNRHQG